MLGVVYTKPYGTDVFFRIASYKGVNRIQEGIGGGRCCEALGGWGGGVVKLWGDRGGGSVVKGGG